MSKGISPARSRTEQVRPSLVSMTEPMVPPVFFTGFAVNRSTAQRPCRGKPAVRAPSLTSSRGRARRRAQVADEPPDPVQRHPAMRQDRMIGGETAFKPDERACLMAHDIGSLAQSASGKRRSFCQSPPFRRLPSCHAEVGPKRYYHRQRWTKIPDAPGRAHPKRLTPHHSPHPRVCFADQRQE
ncbi:hypothetical protein GGR38_004626 [Novosphingobium sediminicola]|uniref:Uncharacterized protein n=1 Tax=Novosphingobium sediminicola TaxID=563162 RepID=A0A7W6CTN8_9SPHN|nr:hypothetical protein [Novosphingobium sediminicola]